MKKTAKRTITVLLAILIIVASLPMTAFATTGNLNSGIAYVLDEESGELTITGKGELDSYDGKTTVTSFEGNTDIKTVNIEAQVTYIPDNMFNNCTMLASVVLPSTLKEIRYYAFGGCKNLTTVELPESINAIGNSAFVNCKKLTTIALPDSLRTIEKFAFSGTGITDINIPASVTSLSVFATALKTVTVDPENPKYDSRNNCNAVIETESNALIQGASDTVIPNGVTEIGEYAFYENPIADITIPDGVTKIGRLAFYKATKLTTLSMPNSVTEIDYGMCSGCTKLTTANLSENITEIPREIFYNCKKITKINIPANVKNIGAEAFCNCAALTEINLPDGLKTVGMEAFYGIKNLTEFYFPDSVTELGMKPLGNCPGLVKVHLPENLRAIPAGMFENCTKLTEWNMPPHITEIGSSAFLGTNVGNPVIPNTVTKIGGSVWRNCPNITEITVPASVNEVGDWAFLCHLVSEETPLKIIFLGNAKISTNWRNLCSNTEVIAPVDGWMNKYVKKFPDDEIKLTAYEGEYKSEYHGYESPVYNGDEKSHTSTCKNCSRTMVQKCEFKAVETVSASCESDGYTVYECEICNGRYKELIPAKGHKLITKTKKATFSDNGYI